MSELTILCVDPDGAKPPEELSNETTLHIVQRRTLAEAKEILADRAVDCLVTEYDLPDGTGLDLISYVREVAPDTGTILWTDADRDRIAADTVPDMVTEYVSKEGPMPETRLAQIVRATVQNRSQTAYPIPDSEWERLAALEEYDLHDELFRSAVQRITDLAAAHFDVDQSSVNLITERTQEFLACHGEEWEATPREQSACTYTILTEGVSVIEDLHADPRFHGYRDPDIRFYAGATITTADGYPIGTLCVYDETPRAFSEADQAYLNLLAAEVTDWLTAVRQIRERTDELPGDSTDVGDAGPEDA